MFIAQQLAGRVHAMPQDAPLAHRVRGPRISWRVRDWKDYRTTGKVCGVALPPGLRESDRLPAPIFTPSTKATSGHDENISFDQVVARVGGETGRATPRLSALEIYRRAAAYAEPRGILLADTKFEFGLIGDELIWIDEALTPDSSRFWPAARLSAGPFAALL